MSTCAYLNGILCLSAAYYVANWVHLSNKFVPSVRIPSVNEINPALRMNRKDDKLIDP